MVIAGPVRLLGFERLGGSRIDRGSEQTCGIGRRSVAGTSFIAPCRREVKFSSAPLLLVFSTGLGLSLFREELASNFLKGSPLLF